MAEERITEIETPDGNVHTTHTIVTEGGEKRAGASGWLIGLVVLVAAIVALYLFSQQNGVEVAKDNAVAEAASNVSDAAGKIGDAAQDAGEAAKDAVKSD